MGEVPVYVCRRTPQPIVVDGVLDEATWRRALPVGDFRLTDGSEPQLPTELKLCWDESNLYLAFAVVDTDIWGTLLRRDDPIYEEEAVEAFLAPTGDPTGYFEFEWSPRNVVFDARIACPALEGDRGGMRAEVGWDCRGQRSAVRVVGTLDCRDDLDQQWTVEAALPFAEIGREGRAPQEGEEWRANFYRIERAGAGEFSCWSPTLKPDFHVPGRFGRIVFSTKWED